MSRKYPCWEMRTAKRIQRPFLRGLGCKKPQTGENLMNVAKIEDVVPKRPPISAYKPPPPQVDTKKCQTKPLYYPAVLNAATSPNTDKKKENASASEEKLVAPLRFPEPKTYNAEVKNTATRFYRILLIPQKRRTKPKRSKQVPTKTLKAEEFNEDDVKMVIKYEKKEWEKKGIKGITNIRTTITTVEDMQIKETYEVTDIEGPNGTTHKEMTTINESAVKGCSAKLENQAAGAGDAKKCPQNESVMDIGPSIKEEIPVNMLQGPDLANFWLGSPYAAPMPQMYQPPGAFDFNGFYPMSFYPMQLMAPAATTAPAASYEVMYYDNVGMEMPTPMPKVNQAASAGKPEATLKQK